MKTSQKVVFVLFISLFLVLCIASMRNNSYTDSEPIYIFQGYSYLAKGETFQSGHPIMTGLISALPLMFTKIDFPPFEDVYHAQRYARNEFLYYGSNDPDRIVFLSRLPFVILSIIFAIYVFKWASDLYGINAGLFALLIYVLSPDILANSTLVMTDLPVAGFMFICLYYYWKVNSRDEGLFRNTIFSGIFFGFAITTKSTAIFLLPLLIILPFFFKKDFRFILRRFLLILLIGISVFALINIRDIAPIYNNNNKFYQSGSQEFRSDERLDSLLTMVTKNENLQDIIKYTLTKIPFPGSNSIQSYLVQVLHSQIGHPQYFLGEYNYHGVWYYYLIVYLIKTPIALILFFIASLIFFNKIRNRNLSNELYVLSIIASILFIVSFIMKLNLGLRHTLIVHLAGFVFLSKIIKLVKLNILYKVFIVLMGAWYVVASLMIFPYYISYFNEFVGGPNNGHKYLVDTSLDLGQDLKRLGIYLEENPIANIKLKYAGFEKPSYRGITYENLTCEPTSGNLIISASALEGVLYHEGKNVPDLECYKWLRGFEPVHKIGYSIFIYNLSKEDIESL